MNVSERSTDPGGPPAVSQRLGGAVPTSRPSAVAAYLHERAGFAWLDVPGIGWTPDQRVVLRRLRLLPRSLPDTVDHLVVAVRAPGSVPAELVTAALVARRMLAVREVTMTLAIWGDAHVSEGLAAIIARIPAVRPMDDVPDSLPFLTQFGEEARSELQGWVRWQ